MASSRRNKILETLQNKQFQKRGATGKRTSFTLQEPESSHSRTSVGRRESLRRDSYRGSGSAEEEDEDVRDFRRDSDSRSRDLDDYRDPRFQDAYTDSGDDNEDKASVKSHGSAKDESEGHDEVDVPDFGDDRTLFAEYSAETMTLEEHLCALEARIINDVSAVIREEFEEFKQMLMASPPESAPESPAPGTTFDAQFKLFAKFGDSKSTGDAITLSNSDKWFKQAKVIDGKKITTTDTGIYFKQLAKTKKAISQSEYEQFLEVIAKNKKVDLEEIKKKLADCGPPATRISSATASGAVARLTDHTKYTGTHKLRFDEAGKGKGKQGRVDPPNKTGYVSGYKEEGTYDKTHV